MACILLLGFTFKVLLVPFVAYGQSAILNDNVNSQQTGGGSAIFNTDTNLYSNSGIDAGTAVTNANNSLNGTGITTDTSQLASPSSVGEGIKESVNSNKEHQFGCFDQKSDGKDIMGIINGCITLVTYKFMTACGKLALIISAVFNFVFMEYVVSMGKVVGNLDGIMRAWEVLRDLANVFLVFLMVFVGFSMILGSSGYGSKQTLFKVILAALLVNFSSTLAKVVIDISNVAAVEAYAMMIDYSNDAVLKKCTEPFSGSSLKTGDTDCINTGLAILFIEKMKILTIFSAEKVPDNYNSYLQVICLVGGVLFLVLGFVFGAATFMLLSRFVILTVLIIFSPLALVAMITGVQGGKGREWWNTLLNQSLVAPMFLLMLWISYAIFDGIGKRYSFDNMTLTGATSFQLSSIPVLVFFFITGAFLIASLVIAKNLGAMGANAAIGYGKKWSRNTASMLVGGGSSILRSNMLRWGRDQTYGRAMNALARANEATMARMYATDENGKYKHNIVRRGVSRLGDQFLRKGMESQAKGFRDRQKSYRDRTLELSSELGRQNSLAAVNGLINERDVEENKKAIQRMGQDQLLWLFQNHPGLFKNAKLAAALSTAQISGINGSGQYTAAEKAAMINGKFANDIALIERAGRNERLSDDDVKILASYKESEMEFLRKHILKNPDAAAHISAATMEKMLGDANISNDDKEQLINGRYKTLQAAIGKKSAEDIRSALGQIRESEYDMLGKTILSNPLVVENMSQNMFDKLQTSSKIDAFEKTEHKKRRDAHLKELLQDDPDKFAAEFRNMTSAQRARQNKELLTDARVSSMMNADDLRETKKVHDVNTMNAVRANVETSFKALDYENKLRTEEAAMRKKRLDELTARHAQELSRYDEAMAQYEEEVKKAMSDENRRRLAQGKGILKDDEERDFRGSIQKPTAKKPTLSVTHVDDVKLSSEDHSRLRDSFYNGLGDGDKNIVDQHRFFNGPINRTWVGE